MKIMRKYWEVFLISVARRILIGRNVHRCAVVSRRDNNTMWYMAEKLEGIERRMLDEYRSTDGNY